MSVFKFAVASTPLARTESIAVDRVLCRYIWIITVGVYCKTPCNSVDLVPLPRSPAYMYVFIEFRSSA